MGKMVPDVGFTILFLVFDIAELWINGTDIYPNSAPNMRLKWVIISIHTNYLNSRYQALFQTYETLLYSQKYRTYICYESLA